MRNRALRVLGLVLLVGATARAADPKVNTIKKVSANGGTVEIIGTQKPSFTTFPMSDPPRFVIDISEAVFSGVPEDVPVPGTGRITAIKTASYGNDSSAIARVVIGFDRDVEPDVQASGNTLVVKVGPGSAPAVASRSEPAPAPASSATADRSAMDQGRALVAAATASPAKPDEQAARDALARANAKAEADRKAAAAEAAALAEQREAIAKADAERKTREQADREARARAEQERVAQDKARAEAQVRAEAERTAKADAARVAAAQADADRKAQQEASRAAAARAEADRKAREDAARVAAATAAAEKKAQEDAARAEAQRRAQEEASRAEAQRKAQDEASRAAAARAEADRKARDEAARAAAASAAAEKTAQEDAARAEAQRRAQEDAARAEAQRRPQAAASRPAVVATAEPQHPAAREATDARVAEPQSAPASGGAEVSARRKTVMLVGFSPDKSRVFVRTNEPVRYNVSQADDRTVVLELENTTFNRSNDRRPLDTRFFGGPVVQIAPRPASGKTVRLTVTLRDKVGYQARQDGNEVSLQFAP